jgi:hypothetical protein
MRGCMRHGRPRMSLRLRSAHPGYEVPVARMSASDMWGCMRHGRPRISLRLRSAHPGYEVLVARMSTSDMRGCMQEGRPRISLRSRSAHPGYEAYRLNFRNYRVISITGSRPMSRASWRSWNRRRSDCPGTQFVKGWR